MSRPMLEVADIFRDLGAAWRRANAGHVSLDQMKVMSAIERCRTAALGGHVARCEGCAHTVIAYNSCRNRHCPKCQGAAATEWLAAREADLLPVAYFHVVFTLPAAIADIAYQNKAAIYDILFTASAETMTVIAADPKYLGARIGITAVLHTWGSAMTHHPHVHMIVPGGGISADGSRWVPCRPNFFLPVKVLSRLFSVEETGITFTWKDYRIEGPGRYQIMTLPTHEFIRRFLMHVLPRGFHRIRHYGLLASGNRVADIARARELLAVPTRPKQSDTSEATELDEARMLPRPCPCCGGRMMIIETFARGCEPKHRPTPAPQTIKIDTS